MSKEAQIREGLRRMAERHGPVQTILAKVVSVNEDAETCELDDDGFTWYDVRLRPVINGQRSQTIFPKVGTWVLATRIEDNDDWMVLAADEIDKYRMVVGDTTIETDGEKIEIANSTASLKDILNDLLTEVIAIYAPKNVANLTVIQQKINQLLK